MEIIRAHPWFIHAILNFGGIILDVTIVDGVNDIAGRNVLWDEL